LVRCSVIIAVLNNPEGTSATLAALRNQTLPADHYEVLVVDHTSTDRTPELFARETGAVLLRDERAYDARRVAQPEASCGGTRRRVDIAALVADAGAEPRRA
jgi:cellulose synthase/poly-beta-1,6-N-acetylglucosamine synthase-like glycosyltransferase